MMILSWVGFYLGHLAGASWDVQILMIGPVYGGFGVLGSLLVLILGNWISHLDDS